MFPAHFFWLHSPQAFTLPRTRTRTAHTHIHMHTHTHTHTEHNHIHMRDQCLNMVTILHPLSASASASAAAAVTTAAAAASTSAWPVDAVRRLSGKTLCGELSFPATLLLYLRMFFFCVRFSHDQNTVVFYVQFRFPCRSLVLSPKSSVPSAQSPTPSPQCHPKHAGNVLSCARRAYLMSSDR